ncbi:MAG: TauD/TfdA family dioxygenase [Burkholderiales bacterium]|nr:TauD/TfdA family dioxygenase [Burkholderiales bacterium]
MTPALGAEVSCGDVRALDEAAFRQVYRALLDNLVIRIRGQTLSDPELIAFGKRLGALDFAPYAKTGKERARTHPEIVVVSNVTENGEAIGVLRDAEVVWHSDNSYRDRPLSYSALYALEIPPRGGNTGFANMYLALETLDPGLRKRIEGRTLKHDMTYNSAGDLREGFKPVNDVRDAPGPSHPISAPIPKPAATPCIWAGGPMPISTACRWRSPRSCSMPCGRMRRRTSSPGITNGRSAILSSGTTAV